jgi:uncharacterized protein (TIGR00290 family)
MAPSDPRKPPSAGRERTVVSWSSGKDAAFALGEAQRSLDLEVVGLLTTVTSPFGRVSMHGVREALLERQARTLGLRLWKVEIPSPCPNEVYERAMTAALASLRADGVSRMVFGDLYLRDVRDYRESRLSGTGIQPVFPLWGRDTRALAEEMIRSGLDARVVCLDPRVLPRELAGHRFDDAFLRALPEGADPCGENGEFHTFAAAGPMFPEAVPYEVGETVERDGFVFTDLSSP